jgi:hypothetical protein
LRQSSSKQHTERPRLTENLRKNSIKFSAEARQVANLFHHQKKEEKWMISTSAKTRKNPKSDFFTKNSKTPLGLN